MGVRAEFGAALFAGALAGTVAFGAFLVIHAIWILPIWSIAFGGSMLAVLGGACVGWAYDVHRVRLPVPIAGRAAVVFASASLVLAPGLLLLPLPLSPSGRMQSILGQGVAALAGLLLVASPFIAAAVGALLGRSLQAFVATGLAAFTFLIGIGHNIPFFGFGWRGVKMWTIMLTVTAIASVTLVVVEAWVLIWLRRRAGSPRESMPAR